MSRIPLHKIKKAQRQARQVKVAAERKHILRITLFQQYLKNEIDIFELCFKMKSQKLFIHPVKGG